MCLTIITCNLDCALIRTKRIFYVIKSVFNKNKLLNFLKSYAYVLVLSHALVAEEIAKVYASYSTF